MQMIKAISVLLALCALLAPRVGFRVSVATMGMYICRVYSVFKVLVWGYHNEHILANKVSPK